MRHYNLFESRWMTSAFGRPCRHPMVFFLYLQLVRSWLMLLPLLIVAALLGYVGQRWFGIETMSATVPVCLAFVLERLRWIFFHYNDNRPISLLWFLLLQPLFNGLVLFLLRQWGLMVYVRLPDLSFTHLLESVVLNWNVLADLGCSLLCAKFGREGDRFRYPAFALAVVLQELV